MMSDGIKVATSRQRRMQRSAIYHSDGMGQLIAHRYVLMQGRQDKFILQFCSWDSEFMPALFLPL